MKKIELLSPAGDLDNFFTAIRSGTDAVYLGLNKFNARMKADNISLDNIERVVSFAHLKNVKVYITLNTLVNDSEMPEVIDMVGKCLTAGVDAFIVQDYGIIGVLKKVYPNIVLHGSTQLGVHNIRGARVAKSLGLSRVVLSREVSKEDIIDIAKNVDIELEVFIHGAMCVCFSGNCYLSSIKCGASGNRGECRQLCRLPYILSNGEKQKNGYMISPRDNCMIDRLNELIDAGVVSLKIEGRLRRQGYVNIATRVYRQALDELYECRCVSMEGKVSLLKKVFSRGDFIHGYFDGNDIIDYINNSHMGELIGTVINCTKFKDIFRIKISTKANLNTGDGLKIINNGNIITFGVGNIDVIGNNIVVYGKNHVESGSKVYRVLDKVLEDEIFDLSRYIILDMHFAAKIGKPCTLTLSANGLNVSISGATTQEAKQRGLSSTTVIDQLSKLGDAKEYFKIGNITCDIDEGLFLSLGDINKLRRDALEEMTNKIISQSKTIVDKCDELCLCDYKINEVDDNSSLVIIDEKYDINMLDKRYDGIILSPTIYSLDIVEGWVKRVRENYLGKILLNLPIIALRDDIKIIDTLVGYCIDNNIEIVSNNIYGLDYISMGAVVWAGSNMNVCNKYAWNTLHSLGVKECVASIEKWCNLPAGLFKMCGGRRVLMTFAHCPSKTLTNTSCEDGVCGYRGKMRLKGDGVEYAIRRYCVSKCYFELVDSRIEDKTSVKSIDDKRE